MPRDTTTVWRHLFNAGLSFLDYLEAREAQEATSDSTQASEHQPAGRSRTRRAAPWWRVLGLQRIPATLADAERAYRRRVPECHPDRPGGTVAAFRALRAALEEAREHFATI